MELTHAQLDDFISENVGQDNSQWWCLICNYMTAKTRTDVVRHIEAKHVSTPPLLCSLCNKSAKTRDSLRKHMANNHGSHPHTYNNF